MNSRVKGLVEGVRALSYRQWRTTEDFREQQPELCSVRRLIQVKCLESMEKGEKEGAQMSPDYEKGHKLCLDVLASPGYLCCFVGKLVENLRKLIGKSVLNY